MRTSPFVFIMMLNIITQVHASNIEGFSQPPSGNTSSLTLSGWVCQQNNEKALTAFLYAGESRQSAQLIATAIANRKSEDAVRARCLTQADHRFRFAIKQRDIFAYSGQKLYIETQVDSESFPINGRRQYVLPEHPPTELRGFLEGVSRTNGRLFAMGWACQTGIDDDVDITISVRSKTGEEIPITEPVSTNVVAEDAISRICGTFDTKHRFRVPIDNKEAQDFESLEVLARASSVYGSDDVKLSTFRKVRMLAPADAVELSKPNIVVFFTDDQGFADIGVHEALDDIHTPNIDELAKQGALFTQGYVTAPQCSPSRAAMMTGIHQSKFRMDENRHIPMTLDVETLASKLKREGYTTAMFGKWHLEVMNNSGEWFDNNFPDIKPYRVGQVPENVRNHYLPHQRGFDKMLAGYTGAYMRNIDNKGRSIELERHANSQFRVDLVTDTSLTFIDRNWKQPFYMHVAHYAPHVPLEATQEYLDRFPSDMPQRRRYALAMMAAIDDGVGKVVQKLKDYNILDNTIIVFMSDNGAPLGDDMTDAPLSNTREAWNGSRNDPFTGEKGMLTEGALRVPYIVHWPREIPANTVVDTPVSSLDAAYTAVKAAGVEDLNSLDGMDLMPLIVGDTTGFDTRPQHWRFYFQRAIRVGDWKYMQAGIEREYLFDMTKTEPESVNYINAHPDIAANLREQYWQWADRMPRPEPLVEIPAPFAERVDLFLPTER
ncbi:sulfatase [Ningiella sp. W23]|uniref:sulfatase family protein n=1 Tax=Ningiella sp. W23 TaxID=3023715 RepID=UPI003757706F